VSGLPAPSDPQPSPAAPRRIGRILLATDLSRSSEGAADEAIQLARALNAELLAVSVIDGSAAAAFERKPERMDQRRATRELAAQALVIRGRSAGVRTTFLVWEGDPGPSIVDAAEAERADLVVIGSRGRNRVERAVLGSVSDHVIRNARCPVLIVRA
jgi:nucleotide-binding universal stress UspA family protein